MRKSNYRPVHKAEEDDNQNLGSRQTSGEEVEEVEPYSDPDPLLPEERCCCSALQCLATPVMFCASICACCMFYGAAYTATAGSVLTTIEKRFQLKTSELATFLVVNDVISVLMIVFVAYYGHKSHRPRLIGGGTMLVGFGFFLCAMPQFLYDPPDQFALLTVADPAASAEDNGQTPAQQEAVYPVCRGVNGSAEDGTAEGQACTEEEVKSSGALMGQVAWIIVGRILIGIGSSPLSPLALTYIDDCIDKTSTAMALSCIFVAGSIGPFLGFVIGSFSLSKHADFYKGATNVREGDPNWLGAWWLTYVITGAIMMLSGLPIALFPKRMRRAAGSGGDAAVDAGKGSGVTVAEAAERKDDDGGFRDLTEKTDGGKFAFITGFVHALRRLVTNGPYVTLAIGECAMTASFVATIAFMTKYMETQFSLPASATPLFNSVIFTPGWVVGSLVGGVLVKRLELGNKGMARMLIILKPFTLLVLPALMFLGCENKNMAGLTAPYGSSVVTGIPSPDLWAPCNADCACSDDYAPVCGADGVTYATPCHAGCLATAEVMPGADGVGNITVFSECSCIIGGQNGTFGLSGDYDNAAISGACWTDCNTLIPFVVVSAVFTLLGSMTGIPTYMLKFRIVREDDRSVAIGFASFLERLLATIPAPILCGAVIQMACLLLQSSCGYTGNCLVYDIVHFRYAFFGLALALDVTSAIMFVLCYAMISLPRHEELQAVETERADEKTPGSQTDDQHDTTV